MADRLGPIGKSCTRPLRRDKDRQKGKTKPEKGKRGKGGPSNAPGRGSSGGEMQPVRDRREAFAGRGGWGNPRVVCKMDRQPTPGLKKKALEKKTQLKRGRKLGITSHKGSSVELERGEK